MKVFITRIIPSIGIELLQEAGIELTQWKEKRSLTQFELIEFCKDHSFLLSAGHNQLDAYFFEQCRHLRAVSLLSAGHDHVDVCAAAEWKIPVGHTPGVMSNATADVAMLLMLAVSRNAFYHSQRIVKGEWNFYEPAVNLGFELNGKTLGIFGMGQIGTKLAQKCIAAFDMNVIYHNRNRNYDAENNLGAVAVTFEELLSQSDVLSVHAPLSSELIGIFNWEAFIKMKKYSIFINTARGGFHNEKDIINALQKGIIWGAGLDVTNPEPMSKENELFGMPNVCVLPHIGSATTESRNAMSAIAAKNIIAIAKGFEMPYQIMIQSHDKK